MLGINIKAYIYMLTPNRYTQECGVRSWKIPSKSGQHDGWDARAPTNHKWKAFRLQIPLSIATTIAVLGALTFFPRSEVICRDYNKMTWK
jgi:hypothetical protein